MKILFITPHLSTGGGPQYLLKKIEYLIGDNDVYCVEYSNITGGVLVVQRNQIESLLGDRLITLYDNKNELINHIKNIDPDVIHFEELPEYFCDRNVSSQIYVSNRRYKIIETSHDSSFNIKNKQFYPDRFAFVSEYQKKLFSELNIPSDVVEYPIEYKTKKNRDESLKKLGLDPNKTHFLNIGLFTPRKNQAEIIEYAKQLLNENVQFHFVGNQAENFKWYWEPIMKNFPTNCKWWNERKDVDTFYNAMDVFIFSSKGTDNDKETNPLVVKESIGWNIPLLMYNLPVYCGMYDKYKNITWLKKDFEDNVNIVRSFIKKKNNLNLNIWFSNPNRIDIFNLGESFKAKVSIKDFHTNIPLYFTSFDFYQNSGYYITPIGNLDFTTETYFSEFLIEFYDENDTLIEYRTLPVKNLDYTPVKLNKNFSPFDCLYINYKQMFYDDIYKDLNLENLNTVLDIGANVGLFSLYMLRKNCRNLYSIEPTIKAFSQLKEVLKDEVNANPRKLAIHNFTGKSKIKSVQDNSTISGFINEVHPYTNHNMNEEEVDVITLTEFLQDEKIEQIDLIKIDIEGVEYDVIESLSDDTLLKSKRYLIEYHWAKTKDINKMINRFKSLNYIIINKDDPNFEEDLGFFFAYKI